MRSFVLYDRKRRVQAALVAAVGGGGRCLSSGDVGDDINCRRCNNRHDQLSVYRRPVAKRHSLLQVLHYRGQRSALAASGLVSRPAIFAVTASRLLSRSTVCYHGNPPSLTAHRRKQLIMQVDGDWTEDGAIAAYGEGRRLAVRADSWP